MTLPDLPVQFLTKEIRWTRPHSSLLSTCYHPWVTFRNNHKLLVANLFQNVPEEVSLLQMIGLGRILMLVCQVGKESKESGIGLCLRVR